MLLIQELKTLASRALAAVLCTKCGGAAKTGQGCGQFRHKHPVVHRKTTRRTVVPAGQTPGAGAGAHPCAGGKWLIFFKNKPLSTQLAKPYYDYYGFIEELKN